MGTAGRTTSGTGSGMGPGELHDSTMMQKRPLSKVIFGSSMFQVGEDETRKKNQP
jgi:hypothetical protein